MKSPVSTQLETTVAATLSAEDVSCGDYVALLTTIFEAPTYLWTCSELVPQQELVRLKMIPSEAGTPLKVFAICLPFVYARTAAGEIKTLDLRREQIVRLDRKTAREVWQQLKRSHSPSVL